MEKDSKGTAQRLTDFRESRGPPKRAFCTKAGMDRAMKVQEVIISANGEGYLLSFSTPKSEILSRVRDPKFEAFILDKARLSGVISCSQLTDGTAVSGELLHRLLFNSMMRFEAGRSQAP
jgi:hypothetical protein